MLGAGACFEVAFPRPPAVPGVREPIVDLSCPQTSGLAAHRWPRCCLVFVRVMVSLFHAVCPALVRETALRCQERRGAAALPVEALAHWGTRLSSSISARPRTGVSVRPSVRPRPRRQQVDAEVRGCDDGAGVCCLSAWPVSSACASCHALRRNSSSQARCDAKGTCPAWKPRSDPGSAH